jgi:hypothetical protein
VGASRLPGAISDLMMMQRCIDAEIMRRRGRGGEGISLVIAEQDVDGAADGRRLWLQGRVGIEDGSFCGGRGLDTRGCGRLQGEVQVLEKRDVVLLRTFEH